MSSPLIGKNQRNAASTPPLQSGAAWVCWFVVESAYYEGDKAIVVVRPPGSIGLCSSRETENASRAFLDAVRKSMRQIRTVIGATTIDRKLLAAAEHLQYERSAPRGDQCGQSGSVEERHINHADRFAGLAIADSWCGR